MTTIEQPRTDVRYVDETPTGPVPARGMTPAPDPKQTVLDQLGGQRGMILSAVPVVVFVTANALTGLWLAIGIWVALLGAVATIVSLVVRRPLTGVVWNLLHGGTHAWRADRPTLRVHDLATAALALVFAARFVVKEWLYLTDATGRLAVAKISMGTPLTALAAVVVIWAFRRSGKRLTARS